jgi:hypothetical protein
VLVADLIGGSERLFYLIAGSAARPNRNQGHQDGVIAMWKREDSRFIGKTKRLAVISQKTRIGGASGKIVSLHTTDASADHARRQTPHGRTVELNHDMEVGQNVFGTDIVHQNHTAKFG